MAEHPLLPAFVTAHSDVRLLTDDVMAERGETDLTGAYARLVLSGALPLFRQTRDAEARKRFTMRYLLRRE